MKNRAWMLVAGWVVILAGSHPGWGEPFRVATYNLENYVLEGNTGRAVKPAEAKAMIRASIREMKPDVLALQEIGGTNALLELQQALKDEGVDLPFWELVPGADTNIQVAVLSRFPMVARRPHTNNSFLLGGRRFRVSRGFAEVDIEASPDYAFTVFTAHLKSKRVVPEADEAELRAEEARLLREKIDARLAADPQRNIIVLGDFNDTKDSASVRALIGRGRNKLVDTRPAESNGDNRPNANPAWEPRNITWTYHYGKEDSYSRIDYILLSPGMAREWQPNGTRVLTMPNWGSGSDHRPLVATFETQDR